MNEPMKLTLFTSYPTSRRLAVAVCGTALLVGGSLGAFAQSVGVNFVNNGAGGIDNSETSSLSSSETAGAPGYAQANWNNLSRYGIGVTLNDSTGSATALTINWDAPWTSTFGTAAGLGTPDGKLMADSLGGPGNYSTDYTTITNNSSIYTMPWDSKPMVYVGGLNAWCSALGAIGYTVVVYQNDNAYYGSDQMWVQSVSGSPLSSTMVAGPDLTPHLWVGLSSTFSGTYNKIPATATNSSSKAYGANYGVFSSLTNDAILIRTGTGDYENGSLNGFQIVPVYASLASVGVHFANAGGTGYASGSSTDLLAPTDSAGDSDYVQTNWNNLGSSGDTGSVTLNDSTGTATSLSMMWSSAANGSTGTAAGLGTPDGKLMDGYLSTWSPGAATALGGSVYYNSANNNPLAYVGGLQTWYQGQSAAGYDVVLYTTGNPYYETAEGFLESVASGNPFSYNMVEGDVLRPPLFGVDTGNFSGSYVSASGTSTSSKTYGANEIVFHGLTNDAILIRLQCLGYGAGLSGFQIVPKVSISPSVPSAVTVNFTNIAVGTNVVSWSAGTLQTATNVLGPWTYNYTPSPFTDTTTNAAQFYRVWVQK